MKKKKLLLLTMFYFDLEQAVVDAFLKIGWEVKLIENKGYLNDPLHIHTKKWQALFCNKSKHIKENILPHTNEYYDFFLSINLFSFDPIIIKTLKIYNPKIKSVLYLWDNVKDFKWHQFFPYFTSVCSFDLQESKKYKIKYLPNFYLHQPVETSILYDFSCVASCQINRINLLDQFIDLLKEKKIDYFFYLFYDKNSHSFFSRIKYNFIGYTFANYFPNKYLGYKKIYELNNFYKSEIVKYAKLESNAAIKIMRQSKCIVDIAYYEQTGCTHRLIQALALQKKIITNNISVRHEPFYDPDYIYILDKKEIKLDLDWLDIKPKNKIDINYLSIDNWIKTILECETF